MKLITHIDDAMFRARVLKGITDLSRIVSQTLGPGGRPILIEQDNSVLSTKDGVTVAMAYSAEGDIERLVAQAAIEASTRTVRAVGDGTTTSIVLAAAITEAGQAWLQKNPSYSPQRLTRELRELVKNQIEPMIKGMARPIKDLPMEEARNAIFHVAMVSANSDEEIARAVTEATDLVGQDGMIVIEEGAGGLETLVEHKEGYPVKSGLSDLGGSASTAFVNRKNYGDTVLSGAYVALYDGEVNDIETLRPLLERVASEQDGSGMPIRHPLIIFAHGFGDVVLRILANNFRKQTLSVVPMITPRNGQAHGRQAFLYDMAAYVGGMVFEPTGTNLTEASPANIGFVEEARISPSDAVFLTEPEEESISARIDDLRAQMEGKSEFDRDKYRERISRLTGGVATIFAGGATALEAKERRDRKRVLVDLLDTESVFKELARGVELFIRLVPGTGVGCKGKVLHLPPELGVLVLGQLPQELAKEIGNRLFNFDLDHGVSPYL